MALSDRPTTTRALKALTKANQRMRTPFLAGNLRGSVPGGIVHPCSPVILSGWRDTVSLIDLILPIFKPETASF
jgi:hypothetical protein